MGQPPSHPGAFLPLWRRHGSAAGLAYPGLAANQQ
jgi:hypothetical protein